MTPPVMQAIFRDAVRTLRRLLTEELGLFLAILVLIVAFALALVVGRALRGLLTRIGVPEVVEGTPFERTARRFGTSTVTLVAQLSALFVIVVGVVISLRLVGILSAELYITRFAEYLPNLFAAVLVVIVGLIVGDKAEVATSERLRSVKLPEVTLVPTLVKYSVLYVAGLIALDQLEVATSALLVLLAAYSFGVFFIGGLAFKDLLSSAAAGVYLLLNQPYTIGDEVEIDGKRGIVQEVDMFTTRVENDAHEFVIPNRQVFREGIVRVRTDG